MKIVKQSVKLKYYEPDALKRIEDAGRTAYKSHQYIKEDSYIKFAKMLLDKGHLSVFEHSVVSFLAITDRGVSHELVRHRLASYTQESTRFCNYSKDRFGNGLTVVLPVWFEKCYYTNPKSCGLPFKLWYEAMLSAEEYYLELAKLVPPDQARQVLPFSVKTEIYITMNLRELRYFLQLRTKPDVHPQMRKLALDMLALIKKKIPVLFDF